MKSLTEYINESLAPHLELGDIIMQLDESSLEFITESNREVWSKGDYVLKMGDHATSRLDRPVEKGGDGEHIEEEEIINMFKHAWPQIEELYRSGSIDPYDDEVNGYVIQCNAYLEDKGNNKFISLGARPRSKTLWAVFMPYVNFRTDKLDVVIKTLFRGERLNHVSKQERIVIAANGFVKKKNDL